MEGVIQNLTLDMTGGESKSIRAKQCDTNSRWANITLMDNGSPWTIPADGEVFLYVLKQDKETVFDRCEITGQNTVLAPLTGQVLAADGTAHAELYITAPDGDIKSQSFKIIIDKMIFDAEAIESTSEFNGLLEKFNQIQAALGRVEGVIELAEKGADRANASADRAEAAAGSIQVAVDAAEQARADREEVELIRNYMMSEKDSFSGYAKNDSDRRYANAITGTVAGTGSVHPPDAWLAPMLDMLLWGGSQQDTTVGYQLFDPSKLVVGGGSTRVALSITKKGYYIRVSTDVDRGHTYAEYFDDSLIGKNVYMMLDKIVKNVVGANDLKPSFQLAVTLVDDSVMYHNLDVSAKKTVSIPSDAKSVRIRVMSNNTTTSAPSDVTFIGVRICVAENVWEPYTGGVPSPNMQYPQEIRSVTDLLLVSSIAPRNYAWGVSLRNQDSVDSFYSGADIKKELAPGEYTRFTKSIDTTVRSHSSKRLPGLYDNFRSGDQLTMSVDVYIESYEIGEGTAQASSFHVRSYNADKSKLIDLMTIAVNKTVPRGQWVTLSATSVLTDEAISYAAIDAPVLYFSMGTGTYVIRVRDIKIEKGNRVTPSVPALEDVTADNADSYRQYMSVVDLTGYTFRGKNEDRDCIECRNGLYGENQLMGQETVSKASNVSCQEGWKNAAYVLYGVIQDSRKYDTYQTVIPPIMSDRFVADSPHTIAAKVGCNRIGIGSKSIYIGLEGIVPRMDIAACKAWIAENPFEIVYPLAEPAWDPFPDRIQKQFNDFMIYSGQHSCVYAISNTAPDMEVTYVKDSNKVVEQHELDLIELEVDFQTALEQLKLDNNLQ